MEYKEILIKNGSLIAPSGVLHGRDVLIRGGKIRKIGKGIPRNLDSKKILTIDAKSNFVSSGFIDIHIHGCTSSISKTQARFGTTSFLRALSTDEINSIDKVLKEPSRDSGGAKFLGFYLEGPFISKVKCGAQDKRFILKPDKTELAAILKKCGRLIKAITVAPELEGIRPLIKFIRKKGIVVSCGHTNATFEEAKRGFVDGIKLATHLFNAMSGIEARSPGASCAALAGKNIFCEVILDGAHIHPEIFELVLALKGKDKIILITDSIAACDLKDKSIGKFKFIYKMQNGTIAGSNLTLNVALKNSVRFGRLDLKDAIKFVTVNPAKLLRIDNRKGTLEEGKDADIVIFDKNFDVKMTMVEGEIKCAG